MKENVMLTIASLLSILLASIHLAQDVARGMSPGGLGNLFGVAIFVIWLYATLLLAGRRSGYIIVLVISLLLAGIPVIHMRGTGIGFASHRSGGFFFAWTLLALGTSALFSVILAARGLIRMRKGLPI